MAEEKIPVLETKSLGIQFGGLKAVNDVNIEIYDMLGRLVFSKSVNVEYNYQLTLDVSFLPPAMYNVRANSRDIVLSSKIIKGTL